MEMIEVNWKKVFMFFSVSIMAIMLLMATTLATSRAIEQGEVQYCSDIKKQENQPEFFITKNDKEMCDHHDIHLNVSIWSSK